MTKYFKDFKYFYSFLKWRLVITLLLSIVVGFLDGLGLAMFLPLLEMIGGERSVDPAELGNMAVLLDFFAFLHIEINLFNTLLIILFFFSMKGVFKFIETYQRVLTQQYYIRHIRLAGIDGLKNLSFLAFIQNDAGRIQNTLSGETERVVVAYRSYMQSLQTLTMILIYASLALFANPGFSILVIVLGVISNLFYRRLFTKTKQVSREITKMSNSYQGLLMQNVTFFKYLSATNTLNKITHRLEWNIDKVEGLNKKIGLYSSIIQAVREPVSILIIISLIFVQVYYLEENIGVIILSLLFFYRSLTYLMAVQNSWNIFLSVHGSLENIKAFLLELNEGKKSNGAVKIKYLNTKITLDYVSVNLGDKKVLNNVVLTLLKNHTYAFIGKSGAGKTTLINLIAGLIPPTKGSISIDEIPFETLDKSAYQDRIGYITQESVIFNDTLFNNVTLWAEKTTDNLARFEKVLSEASIIDFYDDLEDKEETMLGNGGINLSGGQRQRISIARELYKDIDILIMDEATSALDIETEKAIQANVQALKGKYTILIIAHRFSSIQAADFLVMLDNGQIRDVGTYQEVAARSEYFEDFKKEFI
ncbi:ABC transporter ATP-binding protein [Penaeicola halotolerans]|uniref:ABC transporter ATP-binding protein n=1 Tax=Penaeicola halotolerans TaxID=2793196 RepID=UPI001CF8CBA5|nr:ABC transporter ATP-binding protein [Penaeicola halotolerans]